MANHSHIPTSHYVSFYVGLLMWSGDEWDPTLDPTGRLLVFAASSRSAPQILAPCPYGEIDGS